MPCERIHSDDTLAAVVVMDDSQARAQRHKCAACAYEAGVVAGRINGIAAVLAQVAESFGQDGVAALRTAVERVREPN